MIEKNTNLNRRQAAEFLNISLRTLDRYVFQRKISSVRQHRELYFPFEEIEKFKEKLQMLPQHRGRGKTMPETQEQEKEAPIEDEKKSDFVEVHEARVVEQSEGGGDFPLGLKLEQTIYKKLFEETDEELKKTREKLQMASHRVGVLEGQIKSMVPLIEFKKQKDQVMLLESENQKKEKGMKDLQKQVRLEQTAKKIYAVFLYFMMTILPLLMMLRLLS